MKTNRTLLVTALLMPTVYAADIDIFNASNAFSKPSFASTNGGVDGGLGANVRVINGADDKNVLWTKNNSYFVTDKLFIPRGATLTIEPGTKVYFSVNNNGTTADKTDDKVGAITACRGGRLIANGTAAEPIIFTSIREWEVENNQDSLSDPDTMIGPAPTATTAGQWGGIVLLGQAFISRVDAAAASTPTTQIEGFAPLGSPSAEGDSVPDATQYGISNNFARNDDDNSGILRYVSIRHGGYEFDAGREINGLTLGGVGRGTIIENVEVFANQDDGIEFFGGTVNTKNIIMAFNQDDSFDMDEGYNGTNQFWFSIQNPGPADAGFEADGVGGTSGTSNANFTAADTRNESSNPKIYNATIIGAGRTNTLSQLPNTTGTVQWEKGNHGMVIEDRFAGEIYNSVFDDFAGDLVRFHDGANSHGARFVFHNNTVGRFGGGTVGSNRTYIDNDSANASIYNSLGTPSFGNSPGGTDPMFTAYTRNGSNFLSVINPVPQATSPLLTSSITPTAPTLAYYRGAFGLSGNWAAGWTRVSQLGLMTGAAPAVPIADSDGDGLSDALETTTALTSLGFSSTVNNVNLFSSLYTQTSIQQLRGTGLMIGPVTPGQNAVLTLPLFRSTDLNTWEAAGNATANVPTPAGKRFFRIDLSAQP